MTIVTKPNIEKKAEKPQEKPLVVNDGKHGTCPDHTVMDPNEDVEAWLSSAARRRVSAVSTVCVFIVALVVMSMGIIGGVYLYCQFSRHQMSRFRGWCEIPYERDSILLTRPESQSGSPQPMVYMGDDDAEWTSENLFKEEFELELYGEFSEEIRVPSAGSHSKFIHDFKNNKTGIIDSTSGRCYIMPLDHTHVYPPRTMFDLIKKFWMGYYDVDTKVLRETMRIVHPPLRIEDYNSLGDYIARRCANYPIYHLERISSSCKLKSLVPYILVMFRNLFMLDCIYI
ncbi:integral membrane protein 2C-like [Oratosquilla oratoria]|uniref:integral membrane protein 2C-like n=1 Tax=Oratosquilla oratoria TaxID=337810 RepID=UPI003F76CDF7